MQQKYCVLQWPQTNHTVVVNSAAGNETNAFNYSNKTRAGKKPRFFRKSV